MAFPKGRPRPKGAGRQKGVPNKATADVRAAVAMLVQNLVPEVEVWIRKGARKNPLGAAKVLADIAEYHMPKLSRTELTGQDGGPLEVRVVRFTDPPAK
jgi:hypothetical protein